VRKIHQYAMRAPVKPLLRGSPGALLLFVTAAIFAGSEGVTSADAERLSALN